MATPKKTCFADGGQISKADQLMAEINAKYGVSGKTAESPAPTPAPTPAAPPPKEAPGSLLQKAAGLFGNRAKQIDKAAGYANGGLIGNAAEYWANDNAEFEKTKPGFGSRVVRSLNPMTGFGSAMGAMHTAANNGDIPGMAMAGIQAIPTLGITRVIPASGADKAAVSLSIGKAVSSIFGGGVANAAADEFSAEKNKGYRNGGKIEGPGTPTSDSIPAVVQETGEPIQVSDTERILSAKQELLLQKIAKLFGFDSVDAMLEAGTGAPVGPTVKGGKRAASDGKTPDGMTPEEKAWRLSTGNIAGPYAPDFGKNVGNAIASVLPAEAPLARGLKSDAKAAETPTPDQKLTLPGTPQMSPDPNNAVPRLLAAATESYPQNTPANYKAEPVQKPVITAGMDSKQNYGTGPGSEANAVLERANKARAGLIESMIAANGGNGVAILPDRTNEANMQMDLNKLSPEERVKYQLAQQVSDNTQRGQDLTHQAEMDRNRSYQVAHSKDPLDQQIKGLQVKDLEQMATLRGKILDRNTSAEERDAATAAFRALSGKTDTGKFGGHVVKGQIGEPDTFVTWDERTGQPVFAGTGADVTKSVQTKTVGGSPHPEGTRLKGPDGKTYVVKNGQPVLAQ